MDILLVVIVKEKLDSTFKGILEGFKLMEYGSVTYIIF